MVDEANPTLADVLQARLRIRPYLEPTPLVFAAEISRHIGAEVWLKCEFMLPTRAFKVRGGLNLVSREVELQTLGSSGLTAASTGNHGQSVAYAGHAFGLPVTIFAPQRANPVKVKAMQELGAGVQLVGEDFDEAREACESYAHKTGARYVHSMNEPLLVAGVGTAYLEALMQVPTADVLVVPIGGGSGAAAAGLVAKSINPDIRVIGVQAEGAPAVYRSFRSGRLETTRAANTAAEGLATRVAFALPVNMIRQYVDDIVLVSDAQMQRAQALLFQDLRVFPEMAGAASLAAALQFADSWAGSRIILAVTGANASFQEIAPVWDLLKSENLWP
ncbi:MAG: threonine ammonia-lyase [Sulfobacillus acidophilus]|uniref:Threonine ammonia-lyase n=1 Tax=Sulfobacillus acidophilus TaxID=53633 RepID=A0A2T2WD75_9FIRM|nr:MAG: threonine ammonia-lyase [Sulfobacillus acidophilus]